MDRKNQENEQVETIRKAIKKPGLPGGTSDFNCNEHYGKKLQAPA